MIEVFKILTGKYDSLISPHFPLSSSSVTRGNSFKIITRRCHYDLRKYSFCNRVTNIWNSLPNDVVNALFILNYGGGDLDITRRTNRSASIG